MIEHSTGARETFKSKEKSKKSTIECQRCVESVACACLANLPFSFIELDVPGTKVYFNSTGKAKRVEMLSSTQVNILSSCSGEFKVPFSAGASDSILILP